MASNQYDAIAFATDEEALQFSQSYHVLPEGENPELNTRYAFPVCENEEGQPCVVVFDKNKLKQADKPRIKKENIDKEFKMKNK